MYLVVPCNGVVIMIDLMIRLLLTFEFFFLNYQQHKIGIPANNFFPFIMSFVEFIKLIMKL